jgi:predicted ATPase
LVNGLIVTSLFCFLNPRRLSKIQSKIMLKRIKLKGYKSIQNLDLNLGPVNILIGANGVGKSNLISFFKLLRWMMQTPGQLQLFIAKSGGASALLFEGSDVTPQIEAELTFETDSGINNYSFRLFHAANDTLVFAEEKYRFSRNSYEGFADWVGLESGHKEAKIIDQASLENRTAKTIFKLMQSCAVYQFHNTSETARIRQRWSIHDNLYLREDAANLAPFLLRLQENEPLYYTRIVQTLNQIAPFFSNFVLEPSGGSVILQWEEIQQSQLIFNASQASDGTLRTMALIALLLQPLANLPQVLILDEPELGLHPYAINIIGGLIRSISHHTQVILATQSTLLLDCFDPEEVVVVERNRQSDFSRLQYADLEDWLEEYSLSELWNKNVVGGRPR